MSTGIGCTLWLDGKRFADGSPGDNMYAPVALSGLSVAWGRDTTVDQPGSSSLQVQVMDAGPGPAEYMYQLQTGRRLDVTATGELFPDPTESTFRNPGFESDDYSLERTNAATATSTQRAFEGTRSLRVLPTNPDQRWRVLLPPGQFVPAGTDPFAWDDIPATSRGQEWAWSVRIWAPRGVTVSARPIVYTGPWAGASVPTTAAPVSVPGNGEWALLSGTFVPGAPGRWVGLDVSAFPSSGPAWEDMTEPAPDPTPGDITRTNLATNPSLETNPTGWVYYSGVGATGVRTNESAWTGAYSYRSNWGAGPNIGIRYSGFAAVPTGETVTVKCRFRLPDDAVGDRLRTDVLLRDSPGNLTYATISDAPVTALDGGWFEVAVTHTVPADRTLTDIYVTNISTGAAPWGTGDHGYFDGFQIESGASAGDYFDGATPDIPATEDEPGTEYAWTGNANASTSTARATELGTIRWVDLDPAWTWLDYGYVFIDDIQVLAPAGGVEQTVLVYSGRITDVSAMWADAPINGAIVSVTAQDFTADLDNVGIGDVPWTVEPMGDRFARVLELSGLDVAGVVDAGPAARLLSYQDVDNQAATGLLRDFADSTDGVMWSAVHQVTGPYLWVEDPHERASLYVLAVIDGIVRIIPATGAVDAIDLSSCDVLRDPLEWLQSVSDVCTRAAVTWLEQGVDDDGQPETTERTETIIDAGLERTYGVRRISLTTLLQDAGDAADIATSLLARTAQTGFRASGATIDDGVLIDATAADTEMLLRLLDGTRRIGQALRITDLPEWSPIAAPAPLYLEGGSYVFDNGRWVLSLNVSTPTGADNSAVWNDLDPAWRWVDFDPEISWSDMRGVGIATPADIVESERRKVNQ